MEKIGYINKSCLFLKNGLNLIEKLKDVEIQYGYRDIVEKRGDIVQPVCAGVIITKDNKILIVNKSAKLTGKKSPEKDKTLLYVGGHLDISDIANSNMITFANGMKREILEETGHNVKDLEINEPILIYTPKTANSAKHLGAVFPLMIEKTFDITFTDGKCKFVDLKV